MNLESILRDVNDDELIEELERRKRVKSEKPNVQLCIDWHELVELAKKNVDHVCEYGYEIKDIQHWAYECMMTTVFGDDVFKWVNDNT
jgi:hypothetical protein